MMKLYILLSLFIVLVVNGCGGREVDKEMDLGITLTNRAVNYYLQGQAKMADFAYTRAIAKFRDMGKFCDMARVALLMYTIDGFKKDIYLKDAMGFGTLGVCGEEMNIISFLSGEVYQLDQLPLPYYEFAQYKETGKISYIISAANSFSASDKIKSLLYRFIGKELLANAPEDTIKYVRKAMAIDEQFAWTVNLLEDETILLEAMKKLGKPTDLVESRITVLQKAISEKY